MLTTTGMVFLAMAANEGGRAPSRRQLAARASASDDEIR